MKRYRNIMHGKNCTLDANNYEKWKEKILNQSDKIR